MVIPRIRSDLREDPWIDHVQLGGVLLFIYDKREDLKFKFGLYYNSEFYGNFFMPLYGLDWKINEKLNLFGVLPGSMNLERKLGKKFYAGLKYQSLSATYRFTSPLSGNYYVREGHPSWGHMQVKGYLNYYVAKRIVVYTEFGHTFGRRFDLYKGDDVAPHPVFRRYQDGILFNVGMAYRVRLDDEE